MDARVSSYVPVKDIEDLDSNDSPSTLEAGKFKIMMRYDSTVHCSEN